MSRGWFHVWRKAFDRDDWLKPTKRNPASYTHAWLDICQMAQYEDYEHVGERLRRGEFIASVRSFGARWKWSKSAVSRFLKRLENASMIGTVRGTPQGTIYLVVKYNIYANGDDPLGDTQRDMLRDTSGTLAGQEEEGRRKKEEKYTSDFEELWALAPGRGAKNKSFTAYKKAVKNGTTHLMIVEGRKMHVFDARQKQFVKHLEKWIKDERWTDYESNGVTQSGALDRPNLQGYEFPT